MLMSSWLVYCYFFFFKQKTAYEMRISDWSSDVCSSDLSGFKYPSTIDASVTVGCSPPRPKQAGPGSEPADRGPPRNPPAPSIPALEIGSALGRGRGCQYVLLSVGAVSLKKKNKTTPHIQKYSHAQ